MAIKITKNTNTIENMMPPFVVYSSLESPVTGYPYTEFRMTIILKFLFRMSHFHKVDFFL